MHNKKRRKGNRESMTEYGGASSAKALAQHRKRLLEGLGIPDAEKFVVDDFQREAIAAVVEGKDTLVVAPTGAGKTYIAVEAIAAALDLGLKAIYTTPLKALSNTKYAELKRRFEPQHKVGLLTGDRKIDTDADCVVATTEIYRNELYRDYGRYSVVVLDEVHYLSDLQRGPVWEESIILTPKESSLLMLSASISNPDEIAEWLQAVRGKECKIVIKEGRPVELRLGFLHPDLGIIPLRAVDNHILPEVLDFYGHATLDVTGTRLKFQNESARYGRGLRRSQRGGRGRKRGE